MLTEMGRQTATILKHPDSKNAKILLDIAFDVSCLHGANGRCDTFVSSNMTLLKYCSESLQELSDSYKNIVREVNAIRSNVVKLKNLYRQAGMTFSAIAALCVAFGALCCNNKADAFTHNEQ